LERAAEFGVLAALDDRALTGREATITAAARTWLVGRAHARDHGPDAGHPTLAHLAQGTVCKILALSYDEKPGIQAIGTTAPDLPPVPGAHPTIARDHEYKRHGTVTLMAGIDLLTGQVRALVRDRHRSREFIEFLGVLDTAYPAATAIKIILDNHSAHIYRETKAWLAARPEGRFQFVFTPSTDRGSTLVEGCILPIVSPADLANLSLQNGAECDDIDSVKGSAPATAWRQAACRSV
jgi:transposase